MQRCYVAENPASTGSATPVTYRDAAHGFDGLVAQGVLLLMYLNGFTTRLDDWDLTSGLIYGFDDVRFLEPVVVGDTLRLRMTVTETEPHDETYGRVTFEARLLTDVDDVVLVCDWIQLMERDGQT